MASRPEFLEILSEDLARVEDYLCRTVQSHAQLLPLVYRHTLQAGGKRVRPALTLLSARAFGCREPRVAVLASATELIHIASMIHDDVIDAVDMRRGRSAANAQWTNRISVLVADYLVSKVYSDLARRRELDALAALAAAVDEMCEAELAHIDGRARGDDRTESFYYDVVRGKTGVLMGACCEIGAAAGGARPEQVAALKRYGTALGTAFQIIDDLLDLIGDPQTLGKPVGNDLATGKLTLPVIRALQLSRDGFEARIRAVGERGRIDRQELMKIVRAVEDLQGIEYTRDAARRFAEQAVRELEPVPDCPERRALEALTTYVQQRDT